MQHPGGTNPSSNVLANPDDPIPDYSNLDRPIPDRPHHTATTNRSDDATLDGPAHARPGTPPLTIGELVLDAGVIWIERWHDPTLDETGHDIRSAYVEKFWLGVLGPSAAWLARLLVEGLDAEDAAYKLELSETALALGLGRKVGRHSAFVRSFERLNRFGCIRVNGRGLAVRRNLPSLSPAQVRRLSPPAAADHHRWMEAERAASLERSGHSERARGVAAGLIAMGEDVGTTSQMLRRWGFGPSTADTAARWAIEHSDTGAPASAPAIDSNSARRVA